MRGALEIRTAQALRVAAPGQLSGYAARYGCVSQDLGGFTEEIRPGAFSRSLSSSENIMALLEHDRQKVLGRVGSHTLRLDDTPDGVQFFIDLPDTSYARDLAALVTRQDIAGASFAFTVPAGGDVWGQRNGKPHRELIDVDLHEITITATPAYLDTSVAKRAFSTQHQPLQLRLATLYLETCA